MFKMSIRKALYLRNTSNKNQSYSKKVEMKIQSFSSLVRVRQTPP